MKCLLRRLIVLTTKSPPLRGAWIEIFYHMKGGVSTMVAPLAGGVD